MATGPAPELAEKKEVQHQNFTQVARGISAQCHVTSLESGGALRTEGAGEGRRHGGTSWVHGHDRIPENNRKTTMKKNAGC